MLDALRRRYAEPQRHYHTLEHIESLLTLLEEHKALVSNRPAVEAAVWFHDAVYDPQRRDNEERSAELARAQLGQAGFSPDFIERIADLVLLTKGHECDSSDRDAAVMLDLDLSILGTNRAAYDRYAAQVREEYADVPTFLYRQGRAKVLSRFLESERLFKVDLLRSIWEPSARVNLQRELRALKN